jgi:hypothetical protein
VAALCRGPWNLIENAAQNQCSIHAYRSVRTNVAALVTNLKKTAHQETPSIELPAFSDEKPQPDLTGREARRELIMWISERHADH